MRNAFLVILFCTLIFSCSKDQQLEDLKNQIVGKWEIETRSCGECLNPLTNYPAGNGNIMVLLKDGTFEKRLHDSVIFKGRFFITKSNECGNPDSDYAFSTNESSISTPLFVQIQSGKLQLGTPSCYTDGATTIYRRIE